MNAVASGAGPLQGLKVLELGGIGPAPFACMFLADHGADVLRVDRAGAGFEMPIEPRFDTLQRGKQRISLDLKHPHGPETLLRLVEQADVLVESFRPGVLEKLGLDPEVLLERNPRLIVGRMTGWGQDGPLATRAGHDPTYLARTGVLHAIGRADGPPQMPLSLVGDFGGGAMYLVAGVLAALWERERSGAGQVVDAAIVDGAAHLMASPYSLLNGGAWVDERGRNLIDSGTPFVDVYETADGGHVAVAALEPPFFRALVETLGLDESWITRQWSKHCWPELREQLAAAFRTRSRDDWADLFDPLDACVSPVLSMSEAPLGEHLQDRGTFHQAEHGGYEPAPAPRFSRTASPAPRQAMGLRDQSTAQSLGRWCSRDADRIASSEALTG